MTVVPNRPRSLRGGIMARVLHAYFLMTRALTIGVRAIVRSEDGRFLLVRHTYTAGWHFPGGGVEKGETTRTALSKELLQETGLRLIGGPELHGVFFNKAVSNRDHVLAYLCQVEGDLPDKSASLEIAEIGFFALDDLPDGTDPGTERRMREIAQGLARCEAW